MKDEEIESEELMAQDKPQQAQSNTSRLELAEREENSLGSNPVLLKHVGRLPRNGLLP